MRKPNGARLRVRLSHTAKERNPSYLKLKQRFSHLEEGKAKQVAFGHKVFPNRAGPCRGQVW